MMIRVVCRSQKATARISARAFAAEAKDSSEQKSRRVEAQGAYKTFMDNISGAPAAKSNNNSLWSRMSNEISNSSEVGGGVGGGVGGEKRLFNNRRRGPPRQGVAAGASVPGRPSTGGPRKTVSKKSDFEITTDGDTEDIEELVFDMDGFESVVKSKMTVLYEKYVDSWKPENYPEGTTPPVPLDQLPPGARISFDTSDLDVVDEFIFNGLVESCKTSDSSYRVVLTDGTSPKKWKLPKPRSMEQLIRVTKPNIYAAEAGSLAHTVGSDLWTLMSRYPYYSEDTRSNSANRVAYLMQHYQQLEATMFQDPKVKALVEEEVSFDPRFSPGLRCIFEEEDEKALRQDDVVVSSNFVQGETDWSVEAVVDEDQL